MKIRQAADDDFPGVMRLLRELNPEDPADTSAERHTYHEILEAENFKLFVADEGGFLQGTCYLNIIPNLTRGGRPYAIIENVVTSAEHRREGVGKQLIQHALSSAWDAGCYKVMLMSGRSSSEVKTFYEGCGFNSLEKQAYIARNTD